MMPSSNEDSPRSNPYRVTADAQAPMLEPAIAADNPLLESTFKTRLQVIGIVMLIFGISGILGALYQLIATLAFFPRPTSASDPNVSTGGDEWMRKIQDTITEHMPLQIGMGLFSLILSILLLIVGFGLLSRRRWVTRLGTNVFLAAIFFKVAEAIATVYMQWKMSDAMVALVKQAAEDNSPFSEETIKMMFLGGAIGFFVCIGIPLMAVYGWSAYTLNQPYARRVLNT